MIHVRRLTKVRSRKDPFELVKEEHRILDLLPIIPLLVCSSPKSSACYLIGTLIESSETYKAILALFLSNLTNLLFEAPTVLFLLVKAAPLLPPPLTVVTPLMTESPMFDPALE